MFKSFWKTLYFHVDSHHQDCHLFLISNSPCCECCIISFGWFHDVRILCFETSVHKTQKPGHHPKERIQLSFVFYWQYNLVHCSSGVKVSYKIKAGTTTKTTQHNTTQHNTTQQPQHSIIIKLTVVNVLGQQPYDKLQRQQRKQKKNTSSNKLRKKADTQG